MKVEAAPLLSLFDSIDADPDPDLHTSKDKEGNAPVNVILVASCV